MIKYTVICFCVCAHVHSDVNNKPNTDSRAERVKEELYPLQPISFCSKFSSTLLVLGTPAEGYQKSCMVQFAILVPFTNFDSGNGNNCIPYCTEPYRSLFVSWVVWITLKLPRYRFWTTENVFLQCHNFSPAGDYQSYTSRMAWGWVNNLTFLGECFCALSSITHSALYISESVCVSCST